MKLKFLILLCFLVLPRFIFGQGCISISSENGGKFYLLLNGERQNPTPETNVRIDGLSEDNYYAKILFEDQTKPTISKTIANSKNASGQYQERKFKIVKSKEGDFKLMLEGVVAIPANYNPPAEVYYMHYGQPGPVAPATGNGGGSITITPGINLNINVVDPNEKEAPPATAPPAKTSVGKGAALAPPCQYPMDLNSFKTAKQTVAQASFEDTKFATAQSMFETNCLSTDEVVEICRLFGFEESKLKFAKFAYSRTSDRANYAKVVKALSFPTSKTELTNFINSAGK